MDVARAAAFPSWMLRFLYCLRGTLFFLPCACWLPTLPLCLRRHPACGMDVASVLRGWPAILHAAFLPPLPLPFSPRLCLRCLRA